MKRKVFFPATICAAMLLLAACGNKESERQTLPIKVVTEVVEATSGMYNQNYVGVVEAESSVSMSFTGSGMLTNVPVSEGKYVKKGELIAEIDKTQAMNMLAAAQAQMEQADDAYARLKQLHDNNSLPEMEWVEITKKVEQAKASLDLAKKNVSDCSIYAPVNGVIGKKRMNRGETVLPSMPVATILVIEKVKVRASVPEREIAAVSSDTPSTLTLEALPDCTFEGGTIEKCMEANRMTHTYDIKINLANPDHKLLPGMVAKVSLNGQKDHLQLSVPITAVQKGNDEKYFVWTVADGKAHRTYIEKGTSFSDRIIVLSGVKTGDKVVVEGYQKLSEEREVCE